MARAAGEKTKTKIESTLGAFAAHPVRLRAWLILTKRVASAKEIATELRLELSYVADHVNALKKYGVIELVKTEPVRGALKKYYRATIRPYADIEDFEAMGAQERAVITLLIEQLHMADAAEAITGKTFDKRPSRWHSRIVESVDEEGFEALSVAYREHEARVLEIIEESSNRIAGGAEEIPIATLDTYFEVPAPRPV